jgi:hypothetical protein
MGDGSMLPGTSWVSVCENPLADKFGLFKLKEDNGILSRSPGGGRLAEETGILTVVGRPEDITKGEAAILLQTRQVYEALPLGRVLLSQR